MSPAHRHPPGEPVDIPDHLSHGSSFVHRHYKCRCRRCQDWRRSYDKTRNQEVRKGNWSVRRQVRNWYVCVSSWGATYGTHSYNPSGACIRCRADRETEELWEHKWQESKP